MQHFSGKSFIVWYCKTQILILTLFLGGLATDLPMVCKFKFVRYGYIKQNLVLNVSEVPYFQKCLRASYRPNCSQTDLVTDLPIVCKLKFVRYGSIKKKVTLYVPRFSSYGPLKSEVSNFQIWDISIFNLWF